METTTPRDGSWSPGGRQAFPDRTHPNVARRTPGEERGRDVRGDERYAEKCNPNRPRTPLSDPQRDLVTDYLPLARSMAGRMKFLWPRAIDEFESAAYLALVEAAGSFDPGRGVNFATFARYRIWGALQDVRRELCSRGMRQDRAQTQSPAFVRLGAGTEECGQVLGTEPEKPVGADLETIDLVESWIRRLPRPHAMAFRHIYVDGKTQEEAAALVGCSKATLCRMHSQALTWLQQNYASELAG